MLSPQQWRVLRSRILLALPSLDASNVVAAPTDLPSRAPQGVEIRVLSSVPIGAEAELQHAAGGADELVETVREVFEVTIAITIRSRLSAAAPSHEDAAGYLARSVLRTLGSSRTADAFAAAGIGLQRRAGPRDLSALARGTQWTSIAEVELVVLVADLGHESVDYIASAEGEATISGPDGEPIGTADGDVVPWGTE